MLCTRGQPPHHRRVFPSLRHQRWTPPRPLARRETSDFAQQEICYASRYRLCAAVSIAVSAPAAPAMAARHVPEAGYCVIRWNDTGICQIWNTDLRYKPVELFSKYKVVGKPVPTFVAAADIQQKMRAARSCTL
jgi:hypothetical protein